MRLLVVALLALITCCGQALAYERTIKAAWTKYVGPTDATVSGFNLYQDGTKVCSFLGKDIVTGECKVDLTKLSTSYTLAALFSDGKESPKSTAYVLQDAGPAPQGLTITVVTITAEVKLNRMGAVISFIPKITQEEVPADTVVKTGTKIVKKDRFNYTATTVMVM